MQVFDKAGGMGLDQMMQIGIDTWKQMEHLK
jgi:hypothetical protein